MCFRSLYIITLFLAPMVAFADLDEGFDESILNRSQGIIPEEGSIPRADESPDLGNIDARPMRDPSNDTLKLQPKKSETPKQTTKDKETKTKALKNNKSKQKLVKSDPAEPIQWQAQNLSASKDGRTIELSNNVVVKQGDMTCFSDMSKIYFDNNNNVSRVVAKGNVRVIRREGIEKVSARADEAIYYPEISKVTLRGNAVLWKNNDAVIRGKSISYHLKTGVVQVDKVEGVMQSGPGDINGKQK